MTLRNEMPVHARSKGPHDIRPAGDMRLAGRKEQALPAPGAKPSTEFRGGVWYPKQPALFVMNDVIDCPVPVFGRLPRGFLKKAVLPILGVPRDEVLHLCSGSLREKHTVDIRPEVKPWLVADACALPLPDNSFAGVFLDPPYTPAWSRQYGTKYPPTYPLIREAYRVVKPGGRVAVFHFLVPLQPKGARLVKVFGVTVGMGYQIRALTVFEKPARSA